MNKFLTPFIDKETEPLIWSPDTLSWERQKEKGSTFETTKENITDFSSRKERFTVVTSDDNFAPKDSTTDFDIANSFIT